jgi:hypothetical protein
VLSGSLRDFFNLRSEHAGIYCPVYFSIQDLHLATCRLTTVGLKRAVVSSHPASSGFG